MNRNFLKIMDEVTERLKSTSTVETLQIDTVFQNDLILNLLTSLENEDYIKEVYKAKSFASEVVSTLLKHLLFCSVFVKEEAYYRLV